jgi:hypothetical protein
MIRSLDLTRLDILDDKPYTAVMKKINPLDGLLRLRGRFVLNQKAQVFADKRSKRNKSRAEQRRRALEEQE